MSDADPHHIEEQIITTIHILSELNSDNPTDWTGNLNELCSNNLDKIRKLVTQTDIEHSAKLKRLNFEDNSVLWTYVVSNIQYLFELKDILDKNPKTLSVQHIKILKNVFRNIIGIGLSSNLRPNLPYYTKLPSDSKTAEAVSDFVRHKRLVATTEGILICMKCATLRTIIIGEYLKYILSAFYQIIYCPFKKPNNQPDVISGFVMTEEIYDRLVNDRNNFKHIFPKFSSSIHPALYVRETMMLLGKSSPNWMKKAVSLTLSELIRGPKGLENISRAMLDAAGEDDASDTTKSWKTLNIIAKIVMDSRRLPDFRENICKQLKDLLKLRTKSGEPVKSFERLFTLCTKLLYQQDESLCREVFITHLLRPLICFTNEQQRFVCEEENITVSVMQTVSLLRSLVVDGNPDLPSVPAGIAVPILSVIFHIEAAVIDSVTLRILHEDLKSVILKVLQDSDENLKFSVFDNFLFDFPDANLLKAQNQLEFYVENDLLKVKNNEHVVTFGPLVRADVLKRLVEENSQVTSAFFSYLLNCLLNREKYRKNSTSRDLLHVEDEIVLDGAAERYMAIYKALSELIEDKKIQKQINENPGAIVCYMEKVLRNAIRSGLHKSDEHDSDHFQILFLVVMILQALVGSVSSQDFDRYESLVEPLNVIKKESGSEELKKLSKEILTKLNQRGTKIELPSERTELENALDDICDPLLPVRGHGLMTLMKLIEKKDKSALERKQFILNIFQQNLKNEDSFIYLNAIGGLAAMADIFPDSVLKALTEEYADFTRKNSDDGHEIRMKLGEVLVRVVRLLGEMAPKYKSLLLNTFLVGTKDEDHLIRASSLSNLGEVCKVLGYKLGSIITEVLVCVHAIISTDKAVEARRAAVTVVRQLFVGLEKEMIVFLKDDILPLYRALKHVYYHDSDDVTRLQAQLALEQLNENMKDFVFPNLQLNSEKKVVLLN